MEKDSRSAKPTSCKQKPFSADVLLHELKHTVNVCLIDQHNKCLFSFDIINIVDTLMIALVFTKSQWT